MSDNALEKLKFIRNPTAQVAEWQLQAASFYYEVKTTT